MDGDTNRVADCLSRYYENDGPDNHQPDHDFMSADVKLDPDGESIPIKWYAEMHTAATRQSTHLAEKTEQRVLDSDQMNQQVNDTFADLDSDDDPPAFTLGADGQSLRVSVERDVNLAQLVRAHYHKDPLFMKVLHHLEAHPRFRIKDRLIWTKNQMGRDIVCIPWKTFVQGRQLVEVILDQAHTTIGHFGQLSTSCYMRRFYWWPGSRHRAVLQLVRPVPDHEKLNAEACWAPAFSTNTRSTLAVGWAGLYGPTAQVERLRLFTSRNR